MPKNESKTNIFDYLIWRGDLTLAQTPFQDVDGLILSCLAYHFFDQVLQQYSSAPVTIREAAKRVKALPQKALRMRDPQDVLLLQMMAESRRFQNMKLCYYVDHVDAEKQAQFAALTVLPGDGTAFITYRGTDLTLVGWKEDFNMSFQNVVPAQIAAAAYLLYVTKGFSGLLRLGGHSKGGNLAVFAGAVAPKRIQRRILTIYNHDGPGFQEGMLQFPGYLAIIPKVRAFVPHTAIIGMLMNHRGDYTVVESDEKGIMQHDPYSWAVLGTDFVRLETVSKESEFWDKTLKEWLASQTPEKRGKFIDALFEVLYTVQESETGEIAISPKHAYRTLLTLKDEDEETRRIIFEGFRLLWAAARKTAWNNEGVLQKLSALKLPERKG